MGHVCASVCGGEVGLCTPAVVLSPRPVIVDEVREDVTQA